MRRGDGAGGITMAVPPCPCVATCATLCMANYIIDGQAPSKQSQRHQKGSPVVASERFLTLADVAEILNISASQTYALVRSGDLQGIQIGGRNQWRVERAKLEEYIEQAYKRTASNLNELPSTMPSDA